MTGAAVAAGGGDRDEGLELGDLGFGLGVERRRPVEDRQVEVGRELDVDRRGDAALAHGGGGDGRCLLACGRVVGGRRRPRLARVGAAQTAVQRPHVERLRIMLR